MRFIRSTAASLKHTVLASTAAALVLAVGGMTAHAALAGLSGANTVLRTLDGALAIQQAVNAAGNLLLQAGGAGGDLAITAATTSAGAMSAAAGRDLLVPGPGRGFRLQQPASHPDPP